MIAIGEMGLYMFLLAARSKEAEHGAAAVRALDPFVGGAELEHGKLGLAGDKVNRVDQRRRIDSIEGRTRRSGLYIHVGLLIGSGLRVNPL